MLTYLDHDCPFFSNHLQLFIFLQDFIRASIELGLGETCHSLAWFHKNPETLVAGMNQKNLKIFDMRLSTRPNMGPKPLKSNVTRFVNLKLNSKIAHKFTFCLFRISYLTNMKF